MDHLRIIKTTETPRWELNAEDFSMTPEEYYDYAIEFAKKYRESGLTIPVRLWQVLALNGHDKVYHIVPVKASQSTFCEYEMTCPDILKKLSVYFTYCQGGCPAVGLLFDGSPLGTDIYKCLFFEKGYYRKVSDVMKGWKNLLPLTEAEERLLSGEA